MLRRIRVDDIKPGMTLSRTIYSGNGFPLLAEGASLTEDFVKRISTLGINVVYINDKIDINIEGCEPISEKTRIETVKAIKKAFTDFARTKRLSLDYLRGHVNAIVDEVIHNRHKPIELLDVRSLDDYVYYHCVNVCILAVQTAIGLEYNELKLRDIGLGALLHDLGMVMLEKDILDKEGKLTPKEYEHVKQHCVLGFEQLREFKDLSLLSAHVAYQHHERYDGSGYPRGIKGKDIHEYSRIVSICDVFDALIMDRPYRKAHHPYRALEIIKESAGKEFDPEVIQVFEKMIPDYPAGTFIELDSGEIGVVCKNCRDEKGYHAHVIILLNRDKEPINEPDEIIIDKYSGIKVHRLLEENDVFVKKITG